MKMWLTAWVYRNRAVSILHKRIPGSTVARKDPDIKRDIQWQEKSRPGTALDVEMVEAAGIEPATVLV